ELTHRLAVDAVVNELEGRRSGGLAEGHSRAAFRVSSASRRRLQRLGPRSCARNASSGARASRASVYSRSRPLTVSRTRPASRSTRRCRLTAGRLTVKVSRNRLSRRWVSRCEARLDKPRSWATRDDGGRDSQEANRIHARKIPVQL